MAERLGAHASKLDDSIFWLATPPVAAAQYIRAHSTGTDIHITYAGACPGALDPSIDQRITPTELLLAISSRGVEITAQPMVFENIIPPDRRRHFSAAAGFPDPQRLWEASAFRVAQPTDIDLSIGVAQLLLGDDRVLIDMAPSVGCICRVAPSFDQDPTLTLRSPSPIVREGVVDVVRAAPAMRAAEPASQREEYLADGHFDEAPDQSRPTVSRRQSPTKVVFRRQSAWKRQTPRPGVIIARTSAVMVAVPPTPLFQRTEVRVAIAAAVAVAMLIAVFWIGRSTAPAPGAVTGAAQTESSGPLSRSRSP